MFMLKYPLSTSAPSLFASAIASPPSQTRRTCSPTRSPSNTLGVIQEHRQRDSSRAVSPILIPRSRTTSLLSISAQRPLLQSSSAPVSSPITTRKNKRGKASAYEFEEVGDENVDFMLTPGRLGSTSASGSTSRQSITVNDEDDDFSEGYAQSSHNVNVCVRVRPSKKSNSKEEVWALDGERNRIVPTEYHPSISKRQNGISSPSKKSNGGSIFAANAAPLETADEAYDFRFDTLVPPDASIDELYTSNISPIIDAVVSGYNGTVFAYGQTGSGKTHTMSGSETEKGVIPRAVEEIFQKVEKESSHREFLLRVAYLEIYNESLKDLLAPYPSSSSCTDLSARPASPTKGGSSHMAGGGSDLRIVEAGGRILIQGLREEIVTSAGEILNLIEWGQQRRHQAATDWNERSSRSHCVFILTVESRDQDGTSSDVRFSQLNLIDLAGSERAASEKDRRKEGSFINKSLLTLGTVIAKLSEQCQSGNEDGHIPYRDSKLTRLLQTSLGGNARVAVVCTLSPDKEHAVETLSTLRFGQRCKNIITKAKKGKIVSDKALIAKYRKELERLRGQLEQGTSSVLPNTNDDSIKELQNQREEAEKDVQSMNEKREELKKQVEHLTRLILTGKNVAEEGENTEMDQVRLNGTPRPRKLIRMSDMGTSSPSKRIRLLNDARPPLTPLRDSQENMFMSPTSEKPFALESEVASLKKSLALTAAGRQASEEARAQELHLWRNKVMELEASNKEQEEELDEAEEAFKKLQSERDSLKRKVEEEVEANRLLQLVVESRLGNESNPEEQMRHLLEQSQREAANFKAELRAEMEKQQRMKVAQQEQMTTLKQQLMALQGNLDEEKGKTEQILQLKDELHLLRSSQDSMSTNEETTFLREQLQMAQEARDQAQRELKELYLERGQEDAERDFADLMKGSAADEESVKDKLKRKDAKIQSLYKELEEVKSEQQGVKQDTCALGKTATRRTSSLKDNRQFSMIEEDGSGARAYQQEIERLNAVIASQRSMMTDLEASVDAWKGRLKLQHDIITRLTEATGGKLSIPQDLQSPSTAISSNLKRTASSITSTSPYRGAHTFNKTSTPVSVAPITGLGLGSTSPTKGVGWLATMPGVKAEPLPLSTGLLTSPANRNVRRKTIEHEIEELKGSPRVKSTTDRLLTSKASTASLRTLPSTPVGSPSKTKSSRDYYI